LRRILFAVALLVPATLNADTLTLAWDPVFDSAVAGYRVYVGTASGTYTQVFDAGSDTTFSFTQAVPGTRYYFAVASYADGPVIGAPSIEVSGYSNRYPTIQNPGNLSSTVGSSVTRQLVGSDPDGRPVSYLTSGLPPGLILTTSTGLINGIPTTAGTFPVIANVSDGILATTTSFAWTVTTTPAPAPAPSDGGPPTVSITAPVGASFYETKLATLTLAGTAKDDTKVASVTWANNRGTSGTATGTTSWSAKLTLQAGPNMVTVRAKDSVGNIGSSTANLIYVVPPVQVSPVGDTKTVHPNFVWKAAPAASKYVVKIITAKLVTLTYTVTAEDVGCATTTTTCTFVLPVSLPLGASSWQVEPIVVTDLGAWSSKLAFKILSP